MTFWVLQAPSPADSLEAEITCLRDGGSRGRGYPRKMESIACSIARSVRGASDGCARPMKSSM